MWGKRAFNFAPAIVLTVFYLAVIAYCALAITVLQIRQEIGPDFDTILELSNINAKIEVGQLKILNLTAKAAQAKDTGTASDFAAQATVATGELEPLKEQAKALRERLAVLDKDAAKVSAQTGRVTAILDFLNSRPVSWMAKMPADFVVVFLVTMMGALGGALSTLRKLIADGENPSFSEYILRPALGFVVAIPVFTLFKAGQLVISNNVNAQAGDSLNPFLVAFIGVISGLVAKQAIASIEIAGANFFKNRDEQKPLYARDLLGKQVAALSPTDAAMLTSMLAVAPEEFAAWQSERRPIPRRASEILSAFFRVDDRDLFSEKPKS